MERVEDIVFKNLINYDRSVIRVFQGNEAYYYSMNKSDNYTFIVSRIKTVDDKTIEEERKNVEIPEFRNWIKKISIELSNFGTFKKAEILGWEITLIK